MGKYRVTADGRPVYQEYWSRYGVWLSVWNKYGYPVILGIDTTIASPAVAFGQLEMGVLQIKHELLFSLTTRSYRSYRDVLKTVLSTTLPRLSGGGVQRPG